MVKKVQNLVIVILCLLALPAHAAEPIGSIKSLVGNLYKLENEERIPLKQDDDIFLNEEIETDKDSYTTISFIDNTTLNLGENTILKIDDYVYDPQNDENNAAKFQITKGAFHYISGLIAKKEDPDVTIGLDFGSIGIRGTEIWRDLKNDDNGNPMCRIYVENGQADVFNEQGRVTLGHEDGTKIKGSGAAPTGVERWKEAAIKDIKSKTRAPEETP